MHDLGEGVTLITGGAGFIGSAVAWALNNRNLSNLWLADFLEGNPAKQRNLDALSHQRYLDAGELRQLVRTDSKELSEVNTSHSPGRLLEYHRNRRELPSRQQFSIHA